MRTRKCMWMRDLSLAKNDRSRVAQVMPRFRSRGSAVRPSEYRCSLKWIRGSPKRLPVLAGVGYGDCISSAG